MIRLWTLFSRSRKCQFQLNEINYFSYNLYEYVDQAAKCVYGFLLIVHEVQGSEIRAS